MKKKIIILIIVILIVAISAAVFLMQYLKNKNEIVLFSFKSNQTVTSPLIINGKAIGNWFFEASFPVELVDQYNNHLANGVAQAQGDWMTTNFVDFKVQLGFVAQEDMNGFLIFRNDNPSGLPQNNKEFIVPVKILKTDNSTSKVYIYFNNNRMDTAISCNKVFPVERIVPNPQATDIVAKSLTLARVAVEELLKGPTGAEKSQGFFTNINSGVKIQNLTIKERVAKIDFDEQLEFQVSGSCKVSAIRAEISETLKQFPTVKDVVISINGKTEDILQP